MVHPSSKVPSSSHEKTRDLSSEVSNNEELYETEMEEFLSNGVTTQMNKEIEDGEKEEFQDDRMDCSTDITKGTDLAQHVTEFDTPDELAVLDSIFGELPPKSLIKIKLLFPKPPFPLRRPKTKYALFSSKVCLTDKERSQETAPDTLKRNKNGQIQKKHYVRIGGMLVIPVPVDGPLFTDEEKKYGECVLYEKYVPDIECFNSMPRPKTKLIFPLAFPKPLRPGKKKRSKPSALKAARSTSHPKPLESPTTEPCPPVQILLMEPQPFPSPKSYRCCRRCCRRCWCCKIWNCCRLCMCFRSCRRCRARRGSRSCTCCRPRRGSRSCTCCRPRRGSRSCTCCRCRRRKRDKSVSYADWPAALELPSPSAATYRRQDFSEEKVIAVTLPERSHSMFAALNNSKPPPKQKFLFRKSPKSSRVVLETPRVHPRRFASVIVPERAKASPGHTAKRSTSPSASQRIPHITQAIITPQPSPKQTVAASSTGPFYSKVTPIPEYTGAKEPGNAGKEGSGTETEATPGQKTPTATDAGVPQPPSEGRMSPSPEKCAHKPFMHVLPITRNHSPKLIRPRVSYLQEGQARREDARTPPLPGGPWVQKVVLKSKK